MPKVRCNFGAAPEGCNVKLFSVYNTSRKSLLVLARDPERALSVAYSANHIYALGAGRKDENYPCAEEIKGPFGWLSDFWETLQQAIADRLEGTVNIEGGRMVIGNKVFTK